MTFTTELPKVAGAYWWKRGEWAPAMLRELTPTQDGLVVIQTGVPVAEPTAANTAPKT